MLNRRAIDHACYLNLHHNLRRIAFVALEPILLRLVDGTSYYLSYAGFQAEPPLTISLYRYPFGDSFFQQATDNTLR